VYCGAKRSSGNGHWRSRYRAGLARCSAGSKHDGDLIQHHMSVNGSVLKHAAATTISDVVTCENL
jgi:outer membrane usher protein FimD/PapC